MGDDAKRFLAAIEPFRKDWRAMETRLVAARYDGLLMGAGLVAMLRHERPSEIPTMNVPRVDGLLVVHDVGPSDGLEDLVAGLTSGEVTVVGEKTIWKRWEHPAGLTTPFHLSFSTLYREPVGRWLGAECPTFSLIGYEGELLNTAFDGDRHDTYDAALRGLPEPWDGLGELRLSFLGERSEYSGDMYDDYFASRWTKSFAKVIAPVDIRLSDESQLTSKGLDLVVEWNKRIAGGEISLGAAVFYPGGSSVRKSRRIASRGARVRSFRWRLKNPHDTLPSRAAAFIRYRNRYLARDELWGPGIGLTNRRLAAHASYDEGLSLLPKMLGGGLNEKRFEQGVAWLFHLLGFAVVHYGDEGWDAPDLLAFWESPFRALIVECTLREINVKHKLAKLKARQARLESATGMRFHPVIVTAFHGSNISRTESLEAGREDISIISTPECLQEMLTLASEGADPDRVLDYLRNRIPFAEEGRGLSWM